MLRIDFDERDAKLRELPWGKWFEWLGKRELELLWNKDDLFDKLVSRKY
ncbi:hypothetical protein ACFQU2_42270 [Siccirubricoccus deserti]